MEESLREAIGNYVIPNSLPLILKLINFLMKPTFSIF